ncbi:MAG: BtrH N-terminal domain-containing protein [Chloroflexota bacterium]|nr:BtrH N-terminal domain-containing protein [Chloroflexota bacterium]
MERPFPSEVQIAAVNYGIAPGLAFGLGEGLNLYYSRRSDEIPPHRLRVLPPSFEEMLAARLALPEEEAIAAALAGNGYGVMVCTGDWHGLDAIEKWGEELSRWPMMEGWEQSVSETVHFIEESDGLYRRSYVAFLDEAMRYFDGLETPSALLHEIADNWLDIAMRLRRGDFLERLGSRILRMASLESRFWSMILDRFGQGI